jgi:hypothetical protein
MTYFESQGACQSAKQFVDYFVDNFIDDSKMTSMARSRKVCLGKDIGRQPHIVHRTNEAQESSDEYA